jgi:predicted transposase/invertase (TIGR01784 family)
MVSNEVKNDPVFADPTYDITFKMLFGDIKQKDILISFLNGVLSLEGNNAIDDLQLVDPYLGQEDAKGIKSTIDVRCRTLSGVHIAVEMQKEFKEYYLARSQDYMAKLLISEVQHGESQAYHNKLSKTYIIVLAKENLFIGNYKLLKETDTLFEKTVVPMVLELNEVMPGNKMHWVFLSLRNLKSILKRKS